MRVIVFDLPVDTLEHKRAYRKFRKFLIEKGFLMMRGKCLLQTALNGTVAAGIEHAVRINRPEDGLVQMLVITEKQFSKMEYVVGEKQTTVLDSDERIVVL